MITTIKNKILRQKYPILFSLLLLTTVFFLWPLHSYAATTPTTPDPTKTIWYILKDYNNATSLGGQVYRIWGTFIKLTNGFVVVLLIAVAFAQILRININTYGVKKILPTLVLAIIAANFSFLFCRLMVDIASVVISLFLQGADGKATSAGSTVGALTQIGQDLPSYPNGPCIGSVKDGCYSYGTLFWQGIANIMIFAGGVVIIMLAYLFVIRNWLIYFLTAMAPLAFMSMAFPQTKSLFNQWWTNFSKWVFMPVVSVFWIWVGSLWFSNIKDSGTFMSFIFAGVCFYLALTTPFKMGGAVMGAWSKAGQKVAKFGVNQYGGATSRMSMIGQNMEKKNPSGWKNTLGRRLNKAGGVLNVPASVAAYKKGRQGYVEEIGKAAMKTNTYAKFGGQAVRIEGSRLRNEDDLKYAGPGGTGKAIVKYEKALVDDAASRPGGVAASDIGKALAAKGLHMTTANDNQKRDAARQILASTGVKNILLKYKGIGGQFNDENEAVMAEGTARNFIQFARGNVTKADLKTAYDDPTTGRTFASSAVGTPTGPVAPGSPQAQAAAANATILAGQQGAASVVGAVNAQALNAASAGGESLEEAAEGIDGGALKVEIEKFNPSARKTLEESYGKMQAGYGVLNRQDSEAFIDEASQKSEEKAKLSGIIGQESSEKLTDLASHGNLSFEDALKSSGINPDEMSAGALKVVQDTYNSLQKSKNDMIEQTYKASKEEIEEELDGIKMVMGASMRDGVLSKDGLKNTNDYLETAENFFKAGDMKQAQSIIETVSGKIPVQAGVTPEAEIEKAIQKRIKHVNQGLRHFEDDKIDISTIRQDNQHNYIDRISGEKKSEAHVDAEAKTAIHMASGNLVVNPKVQALPVTQIANNPVAMQELTNAISGLHESMDAHGEQLGSLATQGTQTTGGGLNQITKMDPASVNAKSMIVDVLNKSIKDGIVGASTTVSQAFSSKSFRDNMAQGVKKALDESRVLKTAIRAKAPTPQPPAQSPTQSAPPATTTPQPDGTLKLPNM